MFPFPAVSPEELACLLGQFTVRRVAFTVLICNPILLHALQYLKIGINKNFPAVLGNEHLRNTYSICETTTRHEAVPEVVEAHKLKTQEEMLIFLIKLHSTTSYSLLKFHY